MIRLTVFLWLWRHGDRTFAGNRFQLKWGKQSASFGTPPLMGMSALSDRFSDCSSELVVTWFVNVASVLQPSGTEYVWTAWLLIVSSNKHVDEKRGKLVDMQVQRSTMLCVSNGGCGR